MFDSLDDKMKHDEQESSTPKERMIQWVLVAITSVVVFGGLYVGIQLLE